MSRRPVVLSLAAVACCAHAENRTIDGTNNNLVNTQMGCTNSDLLRGLSGAYYADGLGSPVDRGNARTISNAVSAQTALGLGNARNLSSWAWQWGQIVDHDFSLVDEGTTEAMNIAIPAGDPTFDPGNTGTATMPFLRSVHTGGMSGPRQHANSLTHWIDGSMIYGSDTLRADTLRGHVGGRLATSAGDFMPFNTTGLPNGGGTSSSLFLAGDVRANEQTGLVVTHTILMREHNRLADLYAAANPGLSDDEIYEKARKMVGAEVQAITYNEWLPAMLGAALPAYTGYDSGRDGSMSTAFSTAAFRIGHTMLNDQLLRFNADGTEFAGGHLNLFQQFFNPSIVTPAGSLDAVIRGLARQQANEVDTQAIDGVRNLLFGGTDGRDLIALNIQRGRDHGIPDYNSLRQDFGLAAATSFTDITSDTARASALEATYGDVNNIDAWIGLFAEDHLPGSSMGLTATTMFIDQFTRLRDGDRFFYLNDPGLSAEDLAFLQGLKLSDLIRLDTGADGVQDGVFFAAIPAPSAGAMLAVAGALGARRRRH